MANKKKSKTKKILSRPAVAIAVIVVAALAYAGAFVTPLVSPYAQYPFYLLKCGHRPVITSTFMASRSYWTPEDEGYRVSALSGPYFCTREEAKSAGFRPSPWTEQGRKEAAQWDKEYDEKKRFSPEKISFQAYVPNLAGYEYTTPELGYSGSIENQVFFTIKNKDGYVTRVREGEVGKDEYESCSTTKYPFEDAGYDSSGRLIRRQSVENRLVSMQHYTMRIGTTYINLENVDSHATIQDVQNIYNSFAELR